MKKRSSTLPPLGYSCWMRAISSPMVARIPSSSSNSRRRASRGCSPSSIFPPGNSHFKGMVWWRVRWHTSSLPSLWISAATTRFIGLLPAAENSAIAGRSRACEPCLFRRSFFGFHFLTVIFGRSAAGLFELCSDQGGAVLDETLIVESKCGGKVAIDIQFADDFAVGKDGHNNFRFGFERAGEISRIFGYIIDYHSFAARRCGAANALVERDSRVRSHGALESAEAQHRRLRAGLQQVKADPVVFQHAVVQQLDHLLHQVLRRGRGRGEVGHFLAQFFHSGGNRHRKNLTSRRAIFERGTRNGGNLPESFRADDIL